MDILNSIKGAATVTVTPNTAALTTVVVVAGGTNVRGIVVWVASVESADVVDSEARVEKATGGNPISLARGTRGSSDKTTMPLFIPAGEPLQYATKRQARVNMAYTIL
jgi:bisphosphoglycerate-dependent phosphoglycerate mutase